MHKARPIFALTTATALLAMISNSVRAIASDDSEKAASGEGVVNAILVDQQKINITHGPIPALGWPGMTTDFQLAKEVELEKIEVGSKVTFRLGSWPVVRTRSKS